MRTRRKLSQAALGRLAQLHRLQIAYLESGRTALPRSDARARLYTALGEHAPQSAITDSTRAGLRDHVCSFCGADDETTWFMATSPLKPGICICAYCVMGANQQAMRAARQSAP
jgi:transcriptional regulator with XRE-family HTH domain